MSVVVPDLPSTWTVRPPEYVEGTVAAADLDAVADLVAACDIAVLGELDTGRDEVVAMFASPHIDVTATVLVHDGDELVGFVWIENDVRAAETWIDVYAHPDERGVQVLSFGLVHGLTAARGHRDEAVAGGATDTWSARGGCLGPDERQADALTAAGFAPVRRFWRMRVDSASPLIPAEAPALPEGVTLVVARTEEERRRVHQVEEASFADHWNHTPRPYEEWVVRELAFPGQDPDGWWLLEVGGVPAAICLLDDSRAELGDGYVGVLGVARGFRGRGLATLLLRRAFVRYRDLGRAGTQLGVDSDSPTGAQRLYEHVGMSPTRVLVAYARELGSEAGSSG